MFYTYYLFSHIIIFLVIDDNFLVIEDKLLVNDHQILLMNRIF